MTPLNIALVLWSVPGNGSTASRGTDGALQVHNPSLTPSDSLRCGLKDKAGKKINTALGKRMAAWVRHYSLHLGMNSKEETSSGRKGFHVRNKGEYRNWRLAELEVRFVLHLWQVKASPIKVKPKSKQQIKGVVIDTQPRDED